MADIEVESGSGYRTTSGDPTPVPIIRVRLIDDDGNKVVIDILPPAARRIGLDLIAAASNAIVDSAVRMWARENGQDGDDIIGWIKAGTDSLFDSEK